MTIDPQGVSTAVTALPFVRSELISLQAYTPHPGGVGGQSVPMEIDRLDTNENPYDLPLALKEELGEMWVKSIESNRYPYGGHDR